MGGCTCYMLLHVHAHVGHKRGCSNGSNHEHDSIQTYAAFGKSGRDLLRLSASWNDCLQKGIQQIGDRKPYEALW